MNSTLNYSDTNDKKWNSITMLDVLKNIVWVVFSVLISLVNIKFNNENIVIPISVAFLIAMIANDIPIVGVLIAEAITLAVRFGIGAFGIYVFEILMLILSIFVLKPIEIKLDSERYKLGKRVIIITIIASLFMYMKKYPFYTVCEFTIFSLCLEYIFYKIFSNGLNVLKNFRINKAYSEIEIISAGVFFVVLLSALLNFCNKYTAIIIGILIMADLWIVISRLRFNYRIIATTAFYIVGFIMFDNPIQYFAYFVFIGIFSKFINKMNKFVLCVVNLFLITILIYVSVKYKFNLIILIEMLVGMFSLLFIKVIKNIEKEKLKEKLSTFKIKVKNAMSYNKTNILYDELYKDRNDVLGEIFKILENNNSISDEEIIKILNDKKVYLSEETNEFDEEIQKMQLKGVTRLINNIFVNIK